MSSASYVLVDEGFGPLECVVRAKAVRRRMCRDLFGGPGREQLLVEFPGGERRWIDRWTEQREACE